MGLATGTFRGSSGGQVRQAPNAPAHNGHRWWAVRVRSKDFCRRSVAGREVVGRRNGLAGLRQAIDERDLVVLVEDDRGGVTGSQLAVGICAHYLAVCLAQPADVVGRQAYSPFGEELAEAELTLHG